VYRRLPLVWLAACGRIGFDATAADGMVGDTTARSYADTILADSPLVYYRLAETVGPDAIDASGNGNHARYSSVQGGTIAYATTGALAGDPDPAVSLTGEGNQGDTSKASVILPLDLNPWSGDFTIEGWVRPNTMPAVVNAFLIWEDYLVSGFRTGWQNDMLPTFWTTESGATSSLTSPVPVVLGAWNYLVFTKAGPTVTIFIAGQPVLSSPVDYVAPAPPWANCVGADHGMPSDAGYDEFAIYDHALTPAQVAHHYAVGITL
jgi:hypothetical protein